MTLFAYIAHNMPNKYKLCVGKKIIIITEHTKLIKYSLTLTVLKNTHLYKIYTNPRRHNIHSLHSLSLGKRHS